jgi:hypothetical protein
MLKLALVLVLAAGLALPVARALSSRRVATAVARGVVARMNSGPDGTLTRRAVCAPDPGRRQMFACDLRSVRSTTIGARVSLAAGSLRFTWQPLTG